MRGAGAVENNTQQPLRARLGKIATSGLTQSHTQNMADALFAVFEDNPGLDNNKKSKKDKKDIAGPSTATVVLQIGEKRDFKTDVIDLALEDSVTKKAKLDDLER